MRTNRLNPSQPQFLSMSPCLGGIARLHNRQPRRLRLEERQYHAALANVLILGFAAGFVVATAIFVIAWNLK